MKKIILSLAFVGSLLANTTSLNAFTAVTSGSWSNALTWGGVGPGSTVSNQDIVIPNGITVDLDMNVRFNGLLNSFSVTGTLMSTGSNDLEIMNGTLTGSGNITLGKMTMGTASAIYSFAGPIAVNVFRDAGAAISISNALLVNDTLDLEAGALVLGSGGSLQLMSNSNIRVNNGVFTNSGGTFVTGVPYDVWYFGVTKITGEELNSGSTRDINVLLNSNTENLVLNSNTSVNGNLNMVAGHVALNGNRLVLNGDLIRNPGAIFESDGTADMELAGNGGALTDNLEFSLNSTLDELYISRDTHTVYLATDLTITNKLHLQEGHLSVNPGVTLAMGAGSMISVVQGGLIVNGTFDGTLSYNVEYVGDSRTTGPELSGSGLNDLTIYLWYPAMIITLSQDIVVPGNFALAHATFALDTFSIRFDGGYYQSTSDSWIRASFLSDMIFSMSVSGDDSLRLDVGSSAGLHDMVIDLPPAGKLTLASDAVIIHQLNLLGGIIRTGDATLHILGPANIVGYSDTRYIETSNNGELRMSVMANAPYKVFPVGTAQAYSPVAIQQSSPAIGGFFIVHVMQGVWTDGDSGTNVAATMPVVNKTWIITRDSGQMINMNIRPGWIVTDEMNGFDRSLSFVKNYNNMQWDSYVSGPAAAGADNTYEIERVGLGNGGPFAVVDNNAPLGIPAAASETAADVYPNPATDYINVNLSNPANDNRQYEIYDASGRLVTSFENANEQNQIDMRNYDNGSYTLRVTNLNTNEVTVRLIIKS